MSQQKSKRVRVLSIAGTDPSGGAGTMADLRTMAALGAYGMGVITNVVAQNTQGVRAVRPMGADLVSAQLTAVSDDVAIDGIKIGMLGSAEIIGSVRTWLTELADTAEGRPPTVLDPVMISTSGTRLLDEDAVKALKNLLSSGLIDVITPNVPELAALLGSDSATDWDELVYSQAAQLSLETHAYVYAKVGHLRMGSDKTDALVHADPNGGNGTDSHQNVSVTRLPGTLVETQNTHGTGCTLSSALAVFGAQDLAWPEAAKKSKEFMNGAIEHADELMVGHGHGPIDQLWNTHYGPQE